MRKITDHIANPVNDRIEITVMDKPGPGGAHHWYRVTGANGDDLGRLHIPFQNGPIAEVGVNGITNEALLAIVIDRLRSFQDGPFACDENGHALGAVQTALHWLKVRTRNRMKRGVEGTSVA